MTAILHCIVTDIENDRLREQLLGWREKANADPLIQKIRGLRAEVVKLTHDRYWYSNQAWGDQARIEDLLRVGSGLVEAGEAFQLTATLRMDLILFSLILVYIHQVCFLAVDPSI